MLATNQLHDTMRDNARAADALLPATDPTVPADFMRDPALTNLNHGSYGITTRFVRERQTQLRDLMEADPPAFFFKYLERLSDRTRVALADLLNADPAGFALIPNGTAAVALALRNAISHMAPGDHILLTDLEYQSTRNELAHIAAPKGITVTEAHIPLPLDTEDPDRANQTITDAIFNAVTPRTKLIAMSHITSATALVLPAAQVIRRAKEHNIETLIDGAHAPGHIHLDLTALDPTYYAASCHKWLGSPKGSGFVFVTEQHRETFRAPFESCRTHNRREDRPNFLADFDYVGTADFTPNLAIPDAIAHLSAQLNNRDGTYAALNQRNAQLARDGANLIREHLAPHLFNAGRIAPDALFANMANIPLPLDQSQHSAATPDPALTFEDPLWDALWREDRIQIPVIPIPARGFRTLRPSVHLHNTLDQFEQLAEALKRRLT